MNTIKNTNNIILTLLALHLLYTNSMLLSSLNNVHIVFVVLFAGSYSILTAIILNKIPNVFLFITAALLDGFGVYAEYSTAIDNEIIALYFGIYTALIVVAIGSLKQLDLKKEEKDVELAVAKGEVSRLKRNIQELEGDIQQHTVNIQELVNNFNQRLKQGAARNPKNLELIEQNNRLLKEIA